MLTSDPLPQDNSLYYLKIRIAQEYSYAIKILIIDASDVIIVEKSSHPDYYLYSLKKGLYTLRINMNGGIKDTVLLINKDTNYLIGDIFEDNVKYLNVIPPPKQYTSALLGEVSNDGSRDKKNNYASSLEYYMHAAIEFSKKDTFQDTSYIEGLENSSLFVFMRFPSVEKYRELIKDWPSWKSLFYEKFEIINEAGETLYSFKGGTGVAVDFKKGWVAFNVKLMHGIYYLLYKGKNARQIPLYVFKNWHTQFFITLGKEPLYGTIRIFISKEREFAPNELTNKFIDVLLEKLQNSDYSLNDEIITYVSQGKYESPMLGLICAYIYLKSKEEKNNELFKMIVRNLQNVILKDNFESPDILALNILESLHFNDTHFDGTNISGTPMLRIGFEAIQKASLENPNLISSYGINDFVSENICFDSPFNTFRPINFKAKFVSEESLILNQNKVDSQEEKFILEESFSKNEINLSANIHLFKNLKRRINLEKTSGDSWLMEGDNWIKELIGDNWIKELIISIIKDNEEVSINDLVALTSISQNTILRILKELYSQLNERDMKILNSSSSLKPMRTCDIVMKGGITSGIVYPKAIYQMATEYRFVNIGGTSAGAIAASLTAAAEFNRRENGTCNGFEILNTLPSLLTENVNGKSRLFSLFQPNKSTKKIFNAVMHFAGKKKCWEKIIFSTSSLIYHFPFVSLLAMIPGAIMMYFLWDKIYNGTFTYVIIITALLTLVLMLVSTIISFVISFNKILSKNSYGLTTGYSEEVNSKSPPLTIWLADMIDRVAGNKDPLKPLTFGDLKNVKDKSKDSIILQMMTTNVTWRRPHTLPFTDALFYFDESEFRTFFPKRVVDWIVSKSNKENAKQGKLPLPDFDDMPIVVGARMSLSFPILISAVPLYAIDYTLANNKKDRKNATPEKCLFSDGGICSNFPIHFFDSPIPGRPTFAFNLDEFHPENPPQKDESKNIYLTGANGDGINDKWFRFEDSLLKFLTSLINTMQNWNDHTQVKMPGYRDRIVNIHLSPDEGGLNLNMPENVITNLSNRGMYAGELLRDRFTGKSKHTMDWNNHRWIRFRTTMSLLEDYLKKIEENFNISNPEIEMSYDDLMKRKYSDPPRSYQFANSQKEFVIEEVEQLRSFIKVLNERMYSFSEGTPKPAPELKNQPKV